MVLIINFTSQLDSIVVGRTLVEGEKSMVDKFGSSVTLIVFLVSSASKDSCFRFLLISTGFCLGDAT